MISWNPADWHNSITMGVMWALLMVLMAYIWLTKD